MSKKFKIPSGYVEVETEMEYNMLRSLILDGYAKDYYSAKKVFDEMMGKLAAEIDELKEAENR